MNLVTGGAGFIGAHLVRLLRQRGEAVRVLDLKAPIEPEPGAEYRIGSIIDPKAVIEAMRDCRRVFHLAALSDLWGPDKSAFLTVNCDGTRQVLAAARAVGVETVVHTSTESILIATGRGRKPQTVNEDTQCRLEDMAGAYCQGKFLAEAEALEAAHAGQRVMVVNPTVPVGPGDPWLTPPTRMLLGFLNGKHPAYLDTHLILADARDIAEGHLLAAERGEPGHRYILGAHDTALADLLALLQQLSGRRMPKTRVPYPLALTVALIGEFIADHITQRPPAAPLCGMKLAGIPVRFDNRRTRRTLDWKPRPLQETLHDAIEDFRRRGLLEVG
ncbi:MAG: NAD-dependent epimerase/dehydratase family protein [Gammaproteobacteria bacterium]